MNDIGAGRYAQMALELHHEPDLARTLQRVAEFARRSTGSDDAGVTLVQDGGTLRTAVATDSRVAEADRLQIELGEGPSIRSPGDTDSFVVDDTAADGRWPTWDEAAAALGLRSVLSARLSTPRSTLGVLNLYGDEPATFGRDDVEVVDILGRHASVALASAQDEDGLRQAVDIRHVIGQAEGVLMERHGWSAEKAFTMLRHRSRASDCKLVDVAEAIIATRRLSE